MCRISIAMTTYNGEKYLLPQLQSLLKQTVDIEEVIIQDDCSTDRTAGLVRGFIMDHNLRNWNFSVNPQNLGYKKNFYHAIEKTAGDIIFLCDQDDVWQDDKVGRIMELFNMYPDALSVNSSFTLIDPKDAAFSYPKIPKTSNNNLVKMEVADNACVKIPFHLLVHQNISPGCTMAFSAKLKAEYLKISRQSIPHDLELNYIAVLRNGLYFYNSELTQYRIHEGNTLGLDPLNINRAEIAELWLQTADLLCEYARGTEMESLTERHRKLSRQRLESLQTRNIWKAFGLYQYRDLYCAQFTVKQRLGDLAYCLHLHGKR